MRPIGPQASYDAGMPVSALPLIPTIAPAGATPGVQMPAAQVDAGGFLAALAAVGAPAASVAAEVGMTGGEKLLDAGLTVSEPVQSRGGADVASEPLLPMAPAALIDRPLPVPAAAPAVAVMADALPKDQGLSEHAEALPPQQGGQSVRAPVPATGYTPDGPVSAPPVAKPSTLDGGGTPRATEVSDAIPEGAQKSSAPVELPEPPVGPAPDSILTPLPSPASERPKVEGASAQPAAKDDAPSPTASPQGPVQTASLSGPLPAQQTKPAPVQATAPTSIPAPSSIDVPVPLQPALKTGGPEAKKVDPALKRKDGSVVTRHDPDPVVQPGAIVQPLPAGADGPISVALPPVTTAPVQPDGDTPDVSTETVHLAKGSVPALRPASGTAAQDTSAPVSEVPEPRVPAPLFAQTLDVAAARHPALPYDATPSGPAVEASTTSVSIRAGTFGTDVGVAIARALDNGPDGARDALLIRLDPRHMGRIDVKMSFDDDGTLRAVVSADQPAALDMLRRESTHLDRALADAGVRADAQSLRFDGSGAGTGGQQRHPGRPHAPASPTAHGELSRTPEGAQPILRSLRGSGHVDLMA